MTEEGPRFSHRTQAILIAISVVTLAILHYTAPHHGVAAQAHHLYRRLFYLPILAAAWTWGRRGGLITAGAVVVLYTPHAYGLFGAHSDPASYIDKTAEILLYLAIGELVGRFVDRERATSAWLRRLLAERDRTIEQRDEALEQLEATQETLLLAEHQAAMGLLTAGLAHEIRNPLGAIRGGAELLSDKAAGDAQAGRVAAIIVRETERLDGVLTRFLRFARRELHEVQPANVSDLVDEVVQLVRSEAEGRGVALEHVRCCATPTVELDPDAVRQVLLNLVMNAMQVQPDGGAVRIVSGEDQRDRERPLFARVEDAGPGVPDDQRAAIFRPYHSNRPGGTGLGLSISRKNLIAHGGSLKVGGSPLGGASFELRLPLRMPPQEVPDGC